MPLTTVTPAAARPRPSARATSSAIGRRPPRPDDRHRARSLLEVGARELLQPADPAGDEQGGRGVVEVAQARGVGGVVATGGVEARPRPPRRATRRRRGARTRSAMAPARAPPSPATSSSSEEREDLAQPALLVAGDLDRPGQPRDEPRPCEARCARPGGPAHAATPTAALISWRYPSAATTCSRCTSSLAARSAIVRARRSVRSRPRALRSPRR